MWMRGSHLRQETSLSLVHRGCWEGAAVPNEPSAASCHPVATLSSIHGGQAHVPLLTCIKCSVVGDPMIILLIETITTKRIHITRLGLVEVLGTRFIGILCSGFRAIRYSGQGSQGKGSGGDRRLAPSISLQSLT